MKYSIFYLTIILFLGGCKSDSQKQREKQLEAYEKLYQTERAKMDPKIFEHRLDSTKYEILEISSLHNYDTYYHVLIKNHPLSEDSVRQFVQDFMHDHCVNRSVLFVVDDKSAHSLIPKKRNASQEVFIGDHFIAFASNYASDITPLTGEIFFYPFQGAAYKKAGGKSNKRKSIGKVEM